MHSFFFFFFTNQEAERSSLLLRDWVKFPKLRHFLAEAAYQKKAGFSEFEPIELQKV